MAQDTIVNQLSHLRLIISGMIWNFFVCSFSDSNHFSLDTLLLCNKTSQGPGFSKTEVQTLNTQVLKLQDGECDQFKNDGFRCIEHYKCIGDDVKLITHGESQTR